MPKRGKQSKKGQTQNEVLNELIDPALQMDKDRQFEEVLVRNIRESMNAPPAAEAPPIQTASPNKTRKSRGRPKKNAILEQSEQVPQRFTNTTLDDVATVAQSAALAAEQLQRLSAGAGPQVDGAYSFSDVTNVAPPAPMIAPSEQTKSEPQPKKTNKRKRKQPKTDTTSSDVVPATPIENPYSPGKITEDPVVPVQPDEVDMDNEAFPETGPFSGVEIKRIEDYVKGFQERHDLTDVELNDLVQDNNRKPQDKIPAFWKGLQDQLPKRNITAIRKRCRRKYHNFEKRGLWDAEEDEKLRSSYQAKPDKWVDIGAMMGRMPEDCRDRWRNYLSCGDQRRKQEWTQKEEKELENAVNDCVIDVRNEERRKAREKGRAFRDDQDWESKINFNVVSTKLNHTRSRLQCYQHWKTMKLRLDKQDEKAAKKGYESTSANENVDVTTPRGKGKAWRQAETNSRYEKMLPGDKHHILKQLAASDSFDEENVRWAKIKRENPDSRWNTADRKHAFNMMKQLIPTQSNLEETLKRLLEHFQTNYFDELNQFYDGPLEETKRKSVKGTKRKEIEERDEGVNGEDVQGAKDADGVQQPNKDVSQGKKRRKKQKPSGTSQENPPLDPVDPAPGTIDGSVPAQNFIPQTAKMVSEGAPMAPMTQMRPDGPIDPQLEMSQS